MHPEKERRHGGIIGRVRRFVMSCVVDTDLNTILVVVLSFQAALIFALFILQERLILVPPPFFDNFVIRLPALYWSVLLAAGIGWQVRGWLLDRECIRRNGAIFSAVVICFLCGPLFFKGPGLSVGVFLVNLWQIIVAARLWVDCLDPNN